MVYKCIGASLVGQSNAHILHSASDVSLFSVSVCGFFQHMMKISYDVVKRWINEAQEAASSDNIMVQVRFSGIL